MSNKRSRHEHDPTHEDSFVNDPDANESGQDDDDDDDKPKSDKKAGRRKIKIEFIQDKSRRHITFSKRKAGIMKKAYELSTLTGTQVLLLVVSETGLVYTFTTAKLQPLVTQPEGKNLIQACLNAPHGQLPSSMPVGTPINRTTGGMQQANNVGSIALPGHNAPPPPPKDDDANDNDESDPRGAASRKRRRASSTTAPPRNNTSPQVTAGAPPGAPNASPHQQPRAALPNAPPISIPGNVPQMPIDSPRSQAAQPTSPSYAAPAGAYPPPAGGDPNMHYHQSYQGQPQQGYYGGHEGQAPSQGVGPSPWGQPPAAVQNNQYARR
ncbi:SRF-TF-domain-containing protein [Epithele typhae]|uniref:SRF-TF-domain-containing protein n=1 Tax=Epithele typhae TaxID=378194 RepID=UPI002007AAA0|nr:SRF-TF-domain-containing protein [Epithele typhae]XP_047878234.1 SRF-TF-domain-containing protein [Epithele typhae]KAH9905514.1 SRF-TF-domain-containing protein [Epithele typhae]KAH9933223.1 SRF-TF-domain-containing protein [Epithele typhae]